MVQHITTSNDYPNLIYMNHTYQSLRFAIANKFIQLFVILFITFLFGSAFSQTPEYLLDVNDRTLVLNNLEFDIDITWTNSGAVSKFEYAGGQFFFDFNPLIANGGTLQYFYVTNPDTSSDLPANLRPRNPMISGSQLRLAANTFPGAGNGFQMPAGIPVKIVRMKLSTSASLFANEPLNLTWRNGPDVPFTKLTAYVATVNTDITNPSSHTISIPNDPLEWNGLIANFFSNTRTVVQGQTVNFYDSTYGTTLPESWKWSFAGGVPDTSSVKNPAGIRYNVPGNYDVSLIVSDSLFSDSITKPGYVTVIPLCTASWKQTLRISDAGNNSDSVKFGLANSGTNGIDICLGEYIIPPPPPSGLFDARLVLPSNVSSKTDIRNIALSNIIWHVSFQPSEAGYPMNFTWDTAAFPESGSVFLKDQATQTIVNIDMRSQSSYVLNNPNISSLMIEYINETVTIPVDSGWSIVSVPLRTADMNYLTLFPDIASQAFTYDNGYVIVNELQNGAGYWMKFNDSAMYSFTGYPITPENINIKPEWNLIGPFESDIPVSSVLSNPPGIVESHFFGYSDGYVIADTLKSGKGYWVKSSSVGYLYEVTFDNAGRELSTSSVEGLVEVRINNGGANYAKLYLGDESELTEDYSLPPVPPSGIYDVRFGSDKFAELLGGSHIVKINSAQGDVRISLNNSRGLKFRIKDAINGEILNELLADGREVIIPANLNNVILESVVSAPITYELFQNYPNPFNPVTTIKYQTASDGIVKLTVYDVLGREIKKLVNGFQSAGVYESKFDASDFSSGVYFYKLQAGNFEQLKKMMIIK